MMATEKSFKGRPPGLQHSGSEGMVVFYAEHSHVFLQK